MSADGRRFLRSTATTKKAFQVAPPTALLELGLHPAEAELLALALQDLVVLVDHRHGEEDTRAAADGAEEVGEDGEGADAQTTERGGGGDVLVQRDGHVVLVLAGLLEPLALLAQLLGDVAGGRLVDLDPHLREQRARREDERDVEDGVDRVTQHVRERLRGRDVVRDTADGEHLAARRVLALLPLAEQVDDNVVGEAAVQDLREEVEVADERGLQNDRHVARVEQLHRVRLGLAAAVGAHGGEVDAEALQEDDDDEDEHRGEQVHDVRELRAVQRLLKRAGLVAAGEQEVEERDDRALELGATAGVQSRRGEALPHDGVADVAGDEQRRRGAEAPALLQEVVEEDAEHRRGHELGDNDDAHEETNRLDVAVHAARDVRDGLDEGDAEGENLLRALHQRTIVLVAGIS
mmetsp:Transcript_49673/g.153448  ORF Transcript_49673/g.153448 Transcript_49673/m.153448 type:complete len:408 (-) Transcript_49673:331-1554(-)